MAVVSILSFWGWGGRSGEIFIWFDIDSPVLHRRNNKCDYSIVKHSPGKTEWPSEGPEKWSLCGHIPGTWLNSDAEKWATCENVFLPGVTSQGLAWEPPRKGGSGARGALSPPLFPFTSPMDWPGIRFLAGPSHASVWPERHTTLTHTHTHDWGEECSRSVDVCSHVTLGLLRTRWAGGKISLCLLLLAPGSH